MHFVRRIPVYHATISQVHATLILLDAVREHPIHFDYVHQISGQDYPLRSNEQFDVFFENTEDSFMCYTLTDNEAIWESRAKCLNGWFVNRYSPNKIGKAIRLVINTIGSSKPFLRLFPRKPVDGYIAGGWDWFSWSDKVVDFVYNQLSTPTPDGRNGLNLQRFNHTYAPCEKFFQTILHDHLEELHIRKHYPLRYISWQAHRPVASKYRPFNLNELDYDFIINSPCFFCRKVDLNESAKLLDMIDKQRGNEFDIMKYSNFI